MDEQPGSLNAAMLCSSSGPDWEDLLSVLEGLKIKVSSAPSVGDAMDLMRGTSFSLILMDLDNDAEWRASLQALRHFAPSVGVLAYSRRPEERLWLDVLDAGGFDLLCRASRKPEIQWIIENALKLRSSRAAAQPATPATSA